MEVIVRRLKVIRECLTVKLAENEHLIASLEMLVEKNIEESLLSAPLNDEEFKENLEVFIGLGDNLELVLEENDKIQNACECLDCVLFELEQIGSLE